MKQIFASNVVGTRIGRIERRNVGMAMITVMATMACWDTMAMMAMTELLAMVAILEMGKQTILFVFSFYRKKHIYIT